MATPASDWLDNRFNQVAIANLGACPACGADALHSCDAADVVGTYAHAERVTAGMAELRRELINRA